MQILPVKTYNSQKIISRKNNLADNTSFEGIIRKPLLIESNLAEKIRVFWIDLKRNYSFYDFARSGGIKKSPVLKNPLIKTIFNFFELPLKNFRKVSDKYFRGGIVACEYDILRLKDKGVKDIISLTEAEKFKPELAEFAKKNGLNYHHIALFEPAYVPDKSQVEQFFNIVKDTKGSIYVHCLHGKERTGIMTFMYEMEVLGRKPEQALNNLVKAGFHVKRNHNMLDFLAQRYPECAKLIENVKAKY